MRDKDGMGLGYRRGRKIEKSPRGVGLKRGLNPDPYLAVYALYLPEAGSTRCVRAAALPLTSVPDAGISDEPAGGWGYGGCCASFAPGISHFGFVSTRALQGVGSPVA